LNRATTALAHDVGDQLVVQTDLCLDEFTDHGHCGVLDSAGRIDNDATLARYAAIALAQAEAGSQLLGLSGMMDGQVATVRDALDREATPTSPYSPTPPNTPPPSMAPSARRSTPSSPATGAATSSTPPTGAKACARRNWTWPRAPMR